MSKDSKIKLIECPRDAMQGMTDFISTKEKVRYLNALLRVGFDTLDFGSFVSPKAIPQMADTEDVINQLDDSLTKLLAIIANTQGANKAVSFDRIDYLGFPLSVSETFQIRNTNKSIAASLEEIKMIQELCVKHSKELVVYLSMAFGNPYKEDYSIQKVLEIAGILNEMGIKILSLADTVGTSSAEEILSLYQNCHSTFPEVEWGLHLHAKKSEVKKKLEAVIASGCIRLDSALGGYGGCPFAQDELVGNIPTEAVVDYFDCAFLNQEALNEARAISRSLF